MEGLIKFLIIKQGSFDKKISPLNKQTELISKIPNLKNSLTNFLASRDISKYILGLMHKLINQISTSILIICCRMKSKQPGNLNHYFNLKVCMSIVLSVNVLHLSISSLHQFQMHSQSNTTPREAKLRMQVSIINLKTPIPCLHQSSCVPQNRQ